MGDAGARAMAKMLAVNDTLQLLELPDNAIGDAGASVLAMALASNRALEEACTMRHCCEIQLIIMRSCGWAATGLAMRAHMRLPRRLPPTAP